MRITVEYCAQIKQSIGMAREEVELEGEMTAQELVIELARRHGEPLRSFLLLESGAPRPTNLLIVGEEQVHWGAPAALSDGDTVTLLPPISGGLGIDARGRR